MDNGTGGESPLSFLEELEPVCKLCNRHFAVKDGYCLSCYVEDGPDTQLIFMDD